MNEDEKCCGNCQFFFEVSLHRGQCRRYPPQAWSESGSETSCCLFFNFPEMRKQEWCGEFNKIEKIIIPIGYELLGPFEKSGNGHA
jgi:hypothetical protein